MVENTDTDRQNAMRDREGEVLARVREIRKRVGWHHYEPWIDITDDTLALCAQVERDQAELARLMGGWEEATIAWAVCASIHREYAKRKDALFTTRQADFVKHEEDARKQALPTTPAPQQARSTRTAFDAIETLAAKPEE